MYRKFTAPNIFNGYQFLPANAVLITSAAGVVIDIVDREDAGDAVEFFEGLLTPGFINAHCHTELSYLKEAIPPNTGLVQFVQAVMKSRGLADELKLDAMRLAELEMYNSGIVAVGDICNTADSILLKEKSKLQWHNFIEVSGFSDAGATGRLNGAKEIYGEFTARLLQPASLSPHAPYSVSKILFQQLNNETSKQLITIHNQECAAENELYQNKAGDFLQLYRNLGISIDAFEPTATTSLQSWVPYFTHQQSIISVHNTFTSQADIDFYAALSGVDSTGRLIFCLCVNANKYIEQKAPPIELLRKNNCSIVIGTDSYASNWQLNIFEEIKSIQLATDNSIPLAEVLRWATSNGAQALQLNQTIGSFEKGKKPGVVLIEGLNDLEITQHSASKRIL